MPHDAPAHGSDSFVAVPQLSHFPASWQGQLGLRNGTTLPRSADDDFEPRRTPTLIAATRAGMMPIGAPYEKDTVGPVHGLAHVLHSGPSTDKASRLESLVCQQNGAKLYRTDVNAHDARSVKRLLETLSTARHPAMHAPRRIFDGQRQPPHGQSRQSACEGARLRQRRRGCRDISTIY